MGHSVALINAGQPEDMEDADWADTVSRNVEHLEIMVAKDYWTTENMTAANAAIAEILKQVAAGTLTVLDAD
jgi:hypothetical protein